MEKKNDDAMSIYKRLGTTPAYAQKIIQGGRLKGFTDVKPQWRIERMTEVFGICGFGWKYEVVHKEMIPPDIDGQVACFVDINLYIKIDGEWSEPIPGSGGNMFITKEFKGLYTSDECYKMAITDALSVAMKTIGVAADVYMGYPGLYEIKGKSVNTETPKQNTPTVAKSPVGDLMVVKVGDANFNKIVDRLVNDNTVTIQGAKKRYFIDIDTEKAILDEVDKRKKTPIHNGNTTMNPPTNIVSEETKTETSSETKQQTEKVTRGRKKTVVQEIEKPVESDPIPGHEGLPILKSDTPEFMDCVNILFENGIKKGLSIIKDTYILLEPVEHKLIEFAKTGGTE